MGDADGGEGGADGIKGFGIQIAVVWEINHWIPKRIGRGSTHDDSHYETEERYLLRPSCDHGSKELAQLLVSAVFFDVC